MTRQRKLRVFSFMNDAEAAQLQLKKKARRRLIGAVVFVSLAALILPVVMDKAPKIPSSGVEITIPEPDATPAMPQTPPAEALPPESSDVPPPAPPVAPPVLIPPPTPAKPPQAAPKPAPVDLQKEAAREAEKLKEAAKIREQEKAKAAAAEQEAKRAADILAGRVPADSATAPAKPAGDPIAMIDKPHVILIGAYANPANVATLRKKLTELKIKSYTEPLGDKTRVRAGPFASRAEAEAALAKMQRIIDVGGVIAVKP
ncbi:MAG: SPOR domain-containing protein [Zoogloeaceae bacterium]|jgi:DedD protein|nr:SPOR domain-containing protein [Zoogloeaceae bacterium]